MNPTVALLLAHSITVRVDDGTLHLAPSSAVTLEIAAAVRADKQELLRILSVDEIWPECDSLGGTGADSPSTTPIPYAGTTDGPSAAILASWLAEEWDRQEAIGCEWPGYAERERNWMGVKAAYVFVCDEAVARASA